MGRARRGSGCVEFERGAEMAGPVGMAGIDDLAAKPDPHRLPGHPLEEKGVGAALKNLRLDLHIVQVQEPLEHRHRQRPPPTPERQGPGHHACHGGLPATLAGHAPRVGGKENDHAAAAGCHETMLPQLRRGRPVLASGEPRILQLHRSDIGFSRSLETSMGVKKTGKGRRKLGQKKRRMRARIRHRKG